MHGKPNPTQLTVKPKQNRLLLHHTQTSSSSPTTTTSKTVKVLISSTCSIQQKMWKRNLPKLNTLEVIHRDMEKWKKRT
jgi:hypothetical protein